MILMDAKKKDKIIMAVVIAIVAALMIGIVVIIMMFSNGDLSEESMYVSTGTMSTALFFVVIIYGAMTLKEQTGAQQYEDYLERRKQREKEEKREE